METPTYLAAIEADTAAMLAIGTKLPLDTRVPSCPDWALADLLAHTGAVHRHKTEIVRGGWVDAEPPEPGGPDGDVVEWFGLGAVEMLEVFESADLTKPTWTWCNHDHTAAWWVRRMAHETIIHSADALLCADARPHIDEGLALDGVDEILDEMMIGGPAWGTVEALDRTIALEAGNRRWVLQTAVFSGTSPKTGTTYDALDTFVYGDGPTSATVRTDPSTLDLWLWGRADLAPTDVDGDQSLVEHVRSVAAEATQ